MKVEGVCCKCNSNGRESESDEEGISIHSESLFFWVGCVCVFLCVLKWAGAGQQTKKDIPSHTSTHNVRVQN